MARRVRIGTLSLPRTHLFLNVLVLLSVPALHLLSKGMDVKVILDRLGVQAADRHDMTDVPERGTDRLVQVPKLVKEFVEKGGTVLISEYWARHYGYVVGRELPQQAKLLTDEQMAEELAKRRGTIIDY
jgi:hypothetical protein